MPVNLRKLGVHGKNAPSKKSKTVTASDFSIIGLVGQFERKYLKAFSCTSPSQQQEIFGNNISPNWYGSDVMKSFWDNLQGSKASAWIKSHVGNDGVSVDAVVADKTLTDQEGLASVSALALDVQASFNAHAADVTNHTTAADTVNFPISSVVMTLGQIIDFVNLMITKYSAHEADAALASAWAFHADQETGTHALASLVPITTLAGAITQLTDMKTKLNAHDADADAHGGTPSSHQISEDVPSSTPVPTLSISASYQGEAEYGVSGNRTAFKIESVVRYTTNIVGVVDELDTFAIVDSVIGIKVGDIVNILATGTTPTVISKKITAIDESLNKISWTGDFSTGLDAADNDVLEVPGFKIRTYRKSLSGIETEVETALGQIVCTMESEVADFYAPNVHASNKWIKVTDLADAGTLDETFPSVQPVTYLENGADGTSPSTSAHWQMDLTAFNGKPVRILGNPETVGVTIQKAGEVYCKGRDDTPFWIPAIEKNKTLAQLLVIGSGYQRSDDVLQVNVADWIGITDPFNSSAIAPDRYIPNMGAVMGAWIRTIATRGIHYIPATDEIILVGVNSLDNSNLGDVDDTVRTQLAEYGINIIQFVEGSGFRIRNFFTPSTAVEYEFANGLLMRNFIKVSAQNSLQSSENIPNSYNRIKSDRDAVRTFMYKLWFNGSTNSVPEGETFGIQENPDGSVTTFEDHVEVKADAVNNPLTSINRGERNIQVYFTFPTPAGSIKIDVGIMLR